MPRERKLLCLGYGALALLSFVATWRQNIGFALESGVGFAEGMNGFWPALLVNRASISITVDIFLFCLAAVFFMVFEARRLGIRLVWLYVLFGGLVAISVTFPLFLIARERRLHELGDERGSSELGGGDKLGLAIFTCGTIAFALYTLTL